MKLNWLSPLPPVQLAAAEYTRHLLPSLARFAEVTLWTLQRDWDPWLEEHADVRRIEGEFWGDLNRADMSFFNVGDNAEHHGELWMASRRHPGVLILHGLAFSELFVTSYVDYRQDVDGFRRIMTRFYGNPGAHAVDGLLSGRLQVEDLAESFPLTDHCIERALGVVVHSRSGLARLGDPGGRWLFRTALPYSPERHRRDDSALPREGTAFRLIDFAYSDESRRVAPVLEALAQMPRRERFHLDVYGHLRNPDHLKGRCDELGISATVRFHGAVSGAELEKALEQADLAIHLRHPTLAEASPSLLRCWEHELPCLVNRAGWHAELEEEAVWFVRPETETADVRDALSALAEAPATFLGRGRRGRLVLEAEHDPERCARDLVDAASEVRGSLGSAVAFEIARRAGGEIGHWQDASARAIAARSVAEALIDLFGAKGST